MLPGGEESPLAITAPETPGVEAPASVRPRFFGVLWWVVLLTIVLDQATKLLVNALVPVYGSHTIIPNLVDLVHVHNAGVAFGLLNGADHPQRSLITTTLALARSSSSSNRATARSGAARERDCFASNVLETGSCCVSWIYRPGVRMRPCCFDCAPESASRP